MGVKLLIAGSRSIQGVARTWNGDWVVKIPEMKALNRLILWHSREYGWDLQDIELVVTGGANGVDLMGLYWALEHGFDTLVMKADWDSYGKKAGILRNKDMAQKVGPAPRGNAVILWDGKSRGSKHMKEEAERVGLYTTDHIYRQG